MRVHYESEITLPLPPPGADAAPSVKAWNVPFQRMEIVVLPASLEGSAQYNPLRPLGPLTREITDRMAIAISTIHGH